MDQFMNDIYNIYELMNNDDESKGFINIKTISKQYLAYYIYRFITKYIDIFNMATSDSEMEKLFKIIGIPEEHNKKINYPLAGKMTNDEKQLDFFIIGAIDAFTKLDKYLKKLPTDKGHQNLLNFLKSRDLKTILKNLIDLQMLLPGLSSSKRPKYMNNNNI